MTNCQSAFAVHLLTYKIRSLQHMPDGQKAKERSKCVPVNKKNKRQESLPITSILVNACESKHMICFVWPEGGSPGPAHTCGLVVAGRVTVGIAIFLQALYFELKGIVKCPSIFYNENNKKHSKRSMGSPSSKPLRPQSPQGAREVAHCLCLGLLT